MLHAKSCELFVCTQWDTHKIAKIQFLFQQWSTEVFNSLLNYFLFFNRNTLHQGFAIVILAPHYWIHISTKQYWNILQKLLICKVKDLFVS
jgi:hypothetical protein